METKSTLCCAICPQFTEKCFSVADVGSILHKKLWPKSEFTNSLKNQRLNILTVNLNVNKKDVNNCFVLEKYWHRAAAALPGWISIKTCTDDLCPVQQGNQRFPDVTERERETREPDKQVFPEASQVGYVVESLQGFTIPQS